MHNVIKSPRYKKTEFTIWLLELKPKDLDILQPKVIKNGKNIKLFAIL